MAEADVLIDTAIDLGEIKDSPIGIGEAVGTGDPVPYRLRMPVRGKDKKEWPVAKIWLHPFDLSVAAKLQAQGINPDPSISDLGDIAKQNRGLSQLIIDKSRGWENLVRVDGSEWKYVPCTRDENGTDADPRVRLAHLGAMFGIIKARAISIAFTLSSEIEGNSESSSGTPTDARDEPRDEPRSSPDN